MVVHGLNVKPIAMLSLIKWLTSHGSEVYLAHLSGHHESTISIKEVTAIIWQEEMLNCYTISRQASLNASVPLYFLGYSLGALLGQSMISLLAKNGSFDKQILIAPAIAIRSRSYLIRLLFFLGEKTTIPGYTPDEYRVNKSLPLHVYKLLFAEEKKILNAKFDGLNIPTLILIDPKDELISYKKILRFIDRFSLTNYEVIILDDDLKSRNGKYHHMILNEETMGRNNWEMATGKMEKFLFTTEEINVYQ